MELPNEGCQRLKISYWELHIVELFLLYAFQKGYLSNSGTDGFPRHSQRKSLRSDMERPGTWTEMYRSSLTWYRRQSINF